MVALIVRPDSSVSHEDGIPRFVPRENYAQSFATSGTSSNWNRSIQETAPDFPPTVFMRRRGDKRMAGRQSDT